MPVRRQSLPFACALTLVLVSAAHAQIPGLGESLQGSWERISEFHYRLVKEVEITREDLTLFAEVVDYYSDTNLLEASGNVVFVQGTQRIAADRIAFNLVSGTGTFYNAFGTMSTGVDRQPGQFGTQEPDVMFRGEMIEKIGTTRYKITRGGFTTCVQPTPRWELTSGSVVVNVDDYALLTNTLFRVKGVPVLYLPVFYYPINKEDRSTGFLIPEYGTSTIRGQSLSNAFFWAISRSQDATILHDRFSRTGQGLGGEYRYVLAPGSEGNVRMYLLNEHEATYDTAGITTTVPARRSYEIRGAVNQGVARGLRARGRVDHFSDVTVQQTYNTSLYDASRRSRTVAGGLTGNWGSYSVSGAYDVSETFFGTTSSSVNGAAPRVTFARAERPIGGAPIYVSFGADYSHLLREGRSATAVNDQGLHRVDLAPQVRVPFTRWSFLTVNSSVLWRNTLWSESRAGGQQVEEGISRRYFDVRSQIVGPVFTRIWDTPDNGYAERFKHSIEPYLNFQRLTAIDQFDRIVRLDGTDSIIGRTTRYTYGVNNRFYAKRQEGGATRTTAREILNVALSQTYYTDARAAQYDEYYRSSFSGAPPSHLSPVSIVARFAPTLESSGSFRAEYDTQYWAFRSMGAEATIVLRDRLQSSIGWNQRRFIEQLAGYNDKTRLDHFLTQSTLLRTRDNQFGTRYSFSFDVRLKSFLQQRLTAYYNTQCCGFSVEYQNYDLTRLGSRAPVAQDRRLNFSFTLAGIGGFSNFFGALGDTP
jgi:LPS-assembly protein